jgi:hypothetical protein
MVNFDPVSTVLAFSPFLAKTISINSFVIASAPITLLREIVEGLRFSAVAIARMLILADKPARISCARYCQVSYSPTLMGFMPPVSLNIVKIVPGFDQDIRYF